MLARLGNGMQQDMSHAIARAARVKKIRCEDRYRRWLN
jgi:hypothetical protein